MAEKEKLKYGGYVNYPLAPKDVKMIEKLLPMYAGADELLAGVIALCTKGWGLKLEPNEENDGWRVVAYNLDRLTPDDDHVYYVSGESSSLHKAICVIIHKLDQLPRDNFPGFVASKPKGEYR